MRTAGIGSKLFGGLVAIYFGLMIGACAPDEFTANEENTGLADEGATQIADRDGLMSSPQSIFASSTCGKPGQRCCDDAKCNSNAFCDYSYICKEKCGATNQVCCEDFECQAYNSCQRNKCIACGGKNQACCDGVNCKSGYLCGTNYKCSACGNKNQQCCDNFQCKSGYACQRNKCVK